MYGRAVAEKRQLYNNMACFAFPKFCKGTDIPHKVSIILGNNFPECVNFKKILRM